MEENYRVLNGRKARGVPKNYSLEERGKRREAMLAIQPKGVAALKARATTLKRKREDQKQLVRDLAAVGVFVPMQEWE